jgi:predicted cupin superfamily sugar epimerase
MTAATRLKLGIALLLLGLVMPAGTLLVAAATDWPGAVKTLVVGILLFGFEIMAVPAVAFMGKDNFDRIVHGALAVLKMLKPGGNVGRTRYTIGLVLFVGLTLFAWITAYVPSWLPDQYAVRVWIMLGLDLLFLASLFILGGDFWDKLRALFVYDARIAFPPAIAAKDWIEALQLRPHPEGGHYRETYRSPESIAQPHLPPRFSGDRSFSTAIYFLLQGSEFSALHRIKQDEVWHFHEGGSLTISVIDPGGNLSTIRLGKNVQTGEVLQAVVQASSLFGAQPTDRGSYALVSCTVAPGFDFADFELPARQELVARYPQHQAVIEQLTRQVSPVADS